MFLLPKWFYVPHLLFVSIIVFGIIYWLLGRKHFFIWNEIEKRMGYDPRQTPWTLFRAFYLSIVTQSLLGYGDFMPLSNTARFFVLFQVMISISVFVHGATQVYLHH